MTEQTFQQKISLYFADTAIYAALLDRRNNLQESVFAYTADVHRNFSEWVQSLGGAITSDTEYLVSPISFSQRLRHVKPQEDISDFNEADRLAYFLEILRSRGVDSSGEPIFENNGELTAYVPLRHENHFFIASANREDIYKTARVIVDSQVPGDLPEDLQIKLSVESAGRAALRSYLIENPAAAQNPFILFLLTPEGMSLAAYLPGIGIVDEYAEEFIKPDNSQSDDREAVADEYLQQLFEDFVVHTVSQIVMRYGDGNKTPILESLRISSIKTVVCSVPASIANLLPDFCEEAIADGFEFTNFNRQPESAIVAGLIQADDHRAQIEYVNFLQDLTGFAVQLDEEKQNEQIINLRQSRERVQRLIIAPFLVAAAIMLGIGINIFRDSMMLTRSAEHEEARAKQLKPQTDLRLSYVKNYDWYKRSLDQMERLRERQAAAISLLDNLNSRFPVELDSSFAIAEMKLEPNGALAIKGSSKTEDASTAFVRSLEYAPHPAKAGAKMFEGLSFDVRRGNSSNVTLAAATPVDPNASVVFTIKGSYTPFAPPAPPTPPAAAPVASR